MQTDMLSSCAVASIVKSCKGRLPEAAFVSCPMSAGTTTGKGAKRKRKTKAEKEQDAKEQASAVAQAQSTAESGASCVTQDYWHAADPLQVKLTSSVSC